MLTFAMASSIDSVFLVMHNREERSRFVDWVNIFYDKSRVYRRSFGIGNQIKRVVVKRYAKFPRAGSLHVIPGFDVR